MDRRKVVLDMDVGIDDAIAILYLAALPSVEIVAVGSAFGNCNGEVAAYNALRVLERCGLSAVPVAVGALRPLVGAAQFWPDVHGDDGLGNTALPPPTGRPTGEHAADQLVRLAHEYPGELDLVAVGPLTNLATSLRTDPDVLTRFRSVTIMGGSGPYPKAGVMREVDANIANDPAAADQVFAAPRRMMTMVGVNVTTPTILDEAALQRLHGAARPQAHLAWSILQCYLDFYQTEWGRRVCSMHDPLAAAIAVDPSVMVRYRDGPVDVVRAALSYRAILMPAASRNGRPRIKERPTTRVAMMVDRPRFLDNLLEALAGPPASTGSRESRGSRG